MLKRLIRLLLEWAQENTVRDEVLEKVKKLDNNKLEKLNNILDTLEELKWKTVMMGSEDFKSFIEQSKNNQKGILDFNSPKPNTPKDPIDSIMSMGGKTRVGDITNPEIYDTLKSMGMSDDDIVEVDGMDDFYGDDTSLFGGLGPMGSGSTALANRPRGGMSMQSMQQGQDIDSIYNYAVFYIYGSKKNNLVTCFSVNPDKEIFVNEQQQFTIKTAADVIEVCEQLNKKFNLDHIYFVTTESSEKIKPYVEEGLNNPEIKIDFLKEMVSFENKVQDLIPLMSSGSVYMLSNPWMRPFQKEMSDFFNSRSGFGLSSGSRTYPRLKSFTYGIEVWENNKETNLFTRDYGIDQKD